MKLLVSFILVPLSFLVLKAPESDITSEDFTFELTVNSSNADSARFNLIVKGFTLGENGARIPLQIEKQNLKTPYKLNLKDGKYTAIVETKVQEVLITSKVQGIMNGNRMGSASGSFKRTILDFGFRGNYSTRGE